MAYKTVEEYIESFPEEKQKLLKQVRRIVKKNAPGAEEGMGYGVPAYKTNGKPLVYFAAFAKHVGFYATPSGHKKFAKELSQYKQGKGSVQFPFEKPLPKELIAEIVKFRVKENG